MNLHKWKNRSLVTDAEFARNMKLGYPVEAFCITTCKTVAYGKIEHIDNESVIIHGQRFRRNGCAFFGLISSPNVEAKSS
ncbi:MULTISPECIES: hypothetical protein [Alteribacter]|uniref:Uncharacterized protein n=1 Tax=Alteribacter keqinensis TaxID=2483800 RepID=A0A3M7TV48_9BACI|nr:MULTISPECIES: hypothetical protein [Alteribacter]MBM7094691.1 hypothetical protein [Alteribacter salitolerans]RNA69109.1 hypothetical protein EBO34_03920 [Alteribacter keqinensis]